MTEPEPMDAAQRESLEYWDGYYAGKQAALRNGEVIARINSYAPRPPSRLHKWHVAGFWACMAMVAVSSTWGWAIGNYNRMDAFDDGVAVMCLLMRLSRPRYPR